MNREFLIDLLQRLRCCANYPMVCDEMTIGMMEARINELITALAEACVNSDHAKATIDEWIYANNFFPSPAEVRRLAWSLQYKFKRQPVVCEQCSGSGWKEVEITKGGSTFNAVVSCDCRKKAS
jgi:hypothetical protein